MIRRRNRIGSPRALAVVAVAALVGTAACADGVAAASVGPRSTAASAEFSAVTKGTPTSARGKPGRAGYNVVAD